MIQWLLYLMVGSNMKFENKQQKEAFDFLSMGTSPVESFDLGYFTELFNFRGVRIDLLMIAFKKKKIKLQISKGNKKAIGFMDLRGRLT